MTHVARIIVALWLCACSSTDPTPHRHDTGPPATDFNPPMTDGSPPATDGTVTTRPTICEVSETIFEKSCAGGGCHNAAQSPRLVPVTKTTSGRESIGRALVEQGYVKPNDPDGSQLFSAISGDNPRMPKVFKTKPSDYNEALSAEDVSLVRRWIEGGASTDCGEAPTGEVVALPPIERLIRVAMAIKGTRPTLAEIEQVRENPDAIEAIVDGYLDSQEFVATIRDLHNQTLQMRQELGFFFPLTNGLEALPADRRFASRVRAELNEEPLRLIEYVIREGRPYTEILTADYTLCNDVTMSVWGRNQPIFEGIDYSIGLSVEQPLAGARYQGWNRCRYVEPGHSTAGVLSTNAFYMRHQSAGGNMNRGRANVITAAFLCLDFLDQPVTLSAETVDLADPDAVLNAVKEPPCSQCHQDLDRIASFLFNYRPTFNQMVVEGTDNPFWMFRSDFGMGQRSPLDYGDTNGNRRLDIPVASLFHQWPTCRDGGCEDASATCACTSGEECEENQRRCVPTCAATQRAGCATQGVETLGERIIEHTLDGRNLFAECAIKNFYSYLSQTPKDDLDADQIDAWSRAFVAGGFDARAMIRTMVLSEAFLASHGAADTRSRSDVRVKKVRPRQADRLIRDLTDFRWRTYRQVEIGIRRIRCQSNDDCRNSDVCDLELNRCRSRLPYGEYGPVNLITGTILGFGVLAGGIDSNQVPFPSHTMSGVSSAVWGDLAAEAAGHVVDVESREGHPLLDQIDLTTEDIDLIRVQLARLHLHLFGEDVAADGEVVSETAALFQAVAAESDRATAWRTTLTAMFQDSRLIFY